MLSGGVGPLVPNTVSTSCMLGEFLPREPRQGGQFAFDSLHALLVLRVRSRLIVGFRVEEAGTRLGGISDLDWRSKGRMHCKRLGCSQAPDQGPPNLGSDVEPDRVVGSERVILDPFHTVDVIGDTLGDNEEVEASLPTPGLGRSVDLPTDDLEPPSGFELLPESH